VIVKHEAKWLMYNGELWLWLCHTQCRLRYLDLRYCSRFRGVIIVVSRVSILYFMCVFFYLNNNNKIPTTYTIGVDYWGTKTICFVVICTACRLQCVETLRSLRSKLLFVIKLVRNIINRINPVWQCNLHTHVTSLQRPNTEIKTYLS